MTYKLGKGRGRHKPQWNQERGKGNFVGQVNIEENLDDDTIQVGSPYDEDWIERAKELGGRWNKDDRTWDFDSSQREEVEKELKLFFPRAFR